MKRRIWAYLELSCPHCPVLDPAALLNSRISNPNYGRICRKGFYYRTSDGRKVERFSCSNCKKSFSRATLSVCFRQKKRQLNHRVYTLLCSGVSQRRIARLLRLNRKTVVKKFLFLAQQAQMRHQAYLNSLAQKSQKIDAIHFDEMESYEHSKCLPLSIPLVVETGTRKILSFRVCRMPANGLLARISLRKYGSRADDRAQAANEVFSEIHSVLDSRVSISSDQNPKYPNWIKRHFHRAIHFAYKGRRGCIAGQGELKKIGFDPLFDLNHTAAMIRANVNRLFRKTWCTTKRKENLARHLSLYIDYHNRVLT